jgi:hypothetical protein
VRARVHAHVLDAETDDGVSHEKKHLSKGVILTKTRYVGFARQPVNDDTKTNLVNTLPAPKSTYRLLDGYRFIDAERKP